ncbi:MAG: T9SS type A sorting domain-containing protein [Bacteroidota bacterium]
MKNYLQKFRFRILFSLVLITVAELSIAQSWSGVGTGLDEYVNGLVTDTVNNVIYAGGHFLNSGTTTVNHVAKWDGTSWSAMNTGTDLDVYTLCMYNGELYMGGRFNAAGSNACSRVARWDGTDWQPMGTGMNDDVFTLQVYNGELYATGRFTMVDGVPASLIAKYNGSTWSALGAGISGTWVTSVQEYNGDIYAAGVFTDAGGVPVHNIAKWDGANWSDVDGGFTGGLNFIDDLAVYNNELVAAGGFDFAGPVAAANIAKWNGTSWSALGSGLTGYGIVIFANAGKLYAGGNFLDAGGSGATMVASYNGTTWDTLGAGCNTEVDAFESYGGELFVGGSFSDAGGLGFSKIAKWSAGCTVSAAASGNNISCLGSCDGVVSVIASGNAPFTFLWSTGAVTDSVTGLCPGTYSVTVTDSSGCFAIDSISISEFALPTASVTGNNPVCFGQCNGTATVTATGRAPFSYSWSTTPVQTTDTATLLCAGTYFVTVTDSAGCTVLDSITIVDPVAAALSFSSSPSPCQGVCNGSATVTTSSVFPPFNYLWSSNPLQTDQTADSLCSGIYSVTVTDSLGCSVLDSITIVDLPPSDLSFSSSSTFCPGVCSGTATVTTTSSFPPYTYTWSTNPVQTNQTADSLCAGIYSVTVTDSLGCFVDSSVTISDGAPFTLSFSSASPLCPASCNGTAAAISTSTYSPFSYSWNTVPIQTTDTATALCAGTYSVIVTDSAGCISVDSVVISDPVLSLTLTSTNTSCSATNCIGTATANVTGPAPFNYVWSTTGTTATITNLCMGTYSVIATDSNNCVLTDSVSISQPDPPTVSFTYTSPLCYGSCNGIVNASASGIAPFTFSWTTGGTDSTINNACFGWNSVTVTDSGGCFAIDSVMVLQPDSLSITSGNTLNVTCHGDCDGYLSVNVNGGTYPFYYLWSTGSAWPDQLNLCAGTYTVTVTDTNGCSNQFINSVTEPDSMIVALTSTDATCMGCNDGTLSTSVTGGTPPYIYFFTPVGTDTTQVTAGTYYLCVTDAHACLSCDSTIVTEPNGIFEFTNSDVHLRVYPNPFNSTAIISIPNSVAVSDNLKIYFYDLLGKEIETISYAVKKSNTIIIDRKNVPAGMYLFKVFNKEEIIGTGRFTVE